MSDGALGCAPRACALGQECKRMLRSEHGGEVQRECERASERERERERESELHTVPLCERHCRRIIGGEDFREGFENQLGIQTGVHKRLQRQRARLLSRFSDPGI